MELGEAHPRQPISPGVIATGIFGKALGLSVEAAEKTPEVMREGLQDRAADPARRVARGHRPRRGIPRQRQIQFHQRP